MPLPLRSLLPLLLVAGCAAAPEGPVQLAGPWVAAARPERPSLRGSCSWPALDNPAVAAGLMAGTFADPLPTARDRATLFACRQATVFAR